MAKERIEDLGRLRAMLEAATDNDLFGIRMDHLGGCRPKDSFETFNSLSDDRKEEFVLQVIYGVQILEELLYDMLAVACGDEDEYHMHN